ncbi:MAG: 30S ribosome-binding factor RbfA [Jatrophihabitans sp.]
MIDPGRARRMAGRIKQIVATGLETQVKDPRLGMVTVTDVKLTGDLHDATVFYTVLGTEFELAETAAGLESAKGVLRSEVGRQTGVRFTPTLAFVLDAVPDTAKHMEELLAAAHKADAEAALARTGATYAGDPDPYKKAEEDAADELDDSAEPGAAAPAADE